MRFDLAIFSMDQSTGRRSPRSRGPERSKGFSADEYNSHRKKENVSRTYQCIDGYCPIAGDLGRNEGRALGLELRGGILYFAHQTEDVQTRSFPRIKLPCPSGGRPHG